MGEPALDGLRGGHQELLGHARALRGNRLQHLQGLLRDDEVKEHELFEEPGALRVVLLQPAEVTALEYGPNQATHGLAQGE
jgi:hypothetical protein